jgi:heme oxygenase
MDFEFVLVDKQKFSKAYIEKMKELNFDEYPINTKIKQIYSSFGLSFKVMSEIGDNYQIIVNDKQQWMLTKIKYGF